MKSVSRFAIAAAALLTGVVIVYMLTYMGDRSRGPLEDVFTKAADAVHQIEERHIHQKRLKGRSESLRGFGKEMTRLRHPQVILTGAFDNQATNTYKPVFDLEQSFGIVFPLIHIYTAWGSKEIQKFPRLEVESILKTGSVPVITWEPWLTDFDPAKFPGIRPVETRDIQGLRDVAAGVYDAYLRDWARAAGKVGKPIFLRMGHEMNDPYRYPWGPQNNAPEDFVAAWRHVRRVFDQENALNIIWVWSPHPAHGWFDFYYPGDDVVDYVGVGVLNYGKVAPWSDWWTFEQMFGQHYDTLSAFGKPLMITEFGSLAVGGDRSQWFREALTDLPERYPMLKSVLFFHYSEDRTTTQEALNWYVRYDTASIQAIAQGIKSWTSE